MKRAESQAALQKEAKISEETARETPRVTEDDLGKLVHRRLLRFDVSNDVTLTATTNASDDVVVFYVGDRRQRFHSNGDGTYTFTWNVAATDGVRHFGVNALSHGSLFDDQSPYDSQAWLLPYLAGTPDLADLAP